MRTQTIRIMCAVGVGCSIALFFLTLFSLRQLPVVDGTKKYSVVCTTSMITDLVQQIVGNRIIVHGLMGPGVDPHVYRARAGDMHKFSQADIIFYNGQHLEGKMVDIFVAMASKKKVVAIADAVPQSLLLSSDFDGVYDPHIWHDVSLWCMAAELVGKVVSDIDRENSEWYQIRTKEYVSQLLALHEEVKTFLHKITQEQRILVTAHDAFRYFGRAYGFQVVGLQGISTESQVGIQEVSSLAQYIALHKIRAIFIESAAPQRNICAVQKAVAALGWHTIIGDSLCADALGLSSENADTYIGMMRYNVAVILRGLYDHDNS